MTSARARLVKSDHSDVEHVLAACGGMGSFSDLVIGRSMVGRPDALRAVAAIARNYIGYLIPCHRVCR